MLLYSVLFRSVLLRSALLCSVPSHRVGVEVGRGQAVRALWRSAGVVVHLVAHGHAR